MEDLGHKGSVSSLPHPLTALGMQTHTEGFLEKETLGQYVERVNVNVPDHSYVVLLNGYPLPAGLWKGVRPRTGDVIVFQAVVEGGGKGNKVLRSIATIAVAVLAAYTGGLAAAAYGGYGTVAGSIAGGLASGVTMIAGTMLVNQLLPMPNVGNQQGILESKEQKEQFQIAGGDNPIRLYEPMALAFGTIKVAPDFSMKPYTTIEGVDNYLYQAFNYGLQPDLVIDQMKIGTNPVSQYQDFNIMVGDANGRLPIAGNVDTQEGFDVNSADGWIVRTTSPNTTTVQVDVAASAYKVNTQDGSNIPQDCVLQMEIRKKGDSTWYPCGDAVYYETGETATHYWSYGYWSLTTGANGSSYNGNNGGGEFGNGGGVSSL